MVEGTHDDVYTGTSNGERMGGADKMSLMCAVTVSALAHVMCCGCRLLLQPDVCNHMSVYGLQNATAKSLAIHG